MELKYYFKNPLHIVSALGRRGWLNWMDDRAYLRLRYRETIGRALDLENPKGFNEKLQWLKLHDRNPLYRTLVDKVLVKKWVEVNIGNQYIIPTIEVWNSPQEIIFEKLPKQFVIKVNHDSGGVFVCKNKDELNIESMRRQIYKRFEHNGFAFGREWPYKDVKPLVFAEEYIEPEDPGEGLVDYKFFCFGGKADCVMACVGRASGKPRFYFLDRGWEVRRYNASSLSLPEGFSLPRPNGLEEMFCVAERLSEGIPFVRVDLYDAGGRVLFGEMTFYPQSGFDQNILPEADERWGKMIDLGAVKAERFGG